MRNLLGLKSWKRPLRFMAENFNAASFSSSHTSPARCHVRRQSANPDHQVLFHAAPLGDNLERECRSSNY